MKKAKSTSRLNRGKLPPAGIKPASSEADLVTPSTSRLRISTLTRDGTAQPDVSRNVTGNTKTASGGGKKNTNEKLNSYVERGISLEDELEFQYIDYIQAMFRKKLEERAGQQMQEELESLQKDLIKKEQILKRTTQRLKNVQFNREVEALHRLQGRNYGKVLETLDSNSTEQYLSDVAQKLEHLQNQLKVKNVELPPGGAGELARIVTETASAYTDLNLEKNEETTGVLKQIETLNNKVVSDLNKIKDNVKTAEDLMITRAVLEIAQKQMKPANS